LAEEDSAQELRAKCEALRIELIEPLRQNEIEKCLQERNSKEYCERFYADFGEGGRTASGGFRQRMFDDLPECVAAREAEEKERMEKRTEKQEPRDTDPGNIRDSNAGKKSRDTAPGKSRDSSTGSKSRDTTNR
jgi:hypothetical protein